MGPLPNPTRRLPASTGVMSALVALSCALMLGCSVPPVGWTDHDLSDTADTVPHDLGVLMGRVLDEGGAPLTGALLVTDPRGYETTSGDGGAFEFRPLPEGTYRVAAGAAGHQATSVGDLRVISGASLELDVVLTPAMDLDGVLEVEVLDATGAPLAGALVETSVGLQTSTDSWGVATLADVGGEVLSLSVTDPTGRHWGRSLDGVSVAELGGAQLSFRLSGRPDDGSWALGDPVCGMCHAEEAEAHGSTRHAGSLRLGVPDPFLEVFQEGRTVTLDSGLAILSMRDGEPLVTLVDSAGEEREHAVEGLLGDPRGASVPFTWLGEVSLPLPVAWRAARDLGGTWSEAEAALLPFEEGTWFDSSGAFSFPATSSPPLQLSAETRCFACHATGFQMSLGSGGEVRMADSLGDEARWTTAGVGCERCHGPGSSHVSSPLGEKALHITRPDRLDAERAGEVCGQCHGATTGSGTDLPYPFHSSLGFYEPGEVLGDFAASTPSSWPSGAASAPGQQWDEHRISVHGAGPDVVLRCFDCHPPHGAARASDFDGNELCLSCHEYLTFGTEEAARAHTAHSLYDPAGISLGGRCTGCHMPATAARVAFGETSGAGDLSSHLHEALPPEDTLELFYAAGRRTLPVGSFPAHACGECHAYSASWIGIGFQGPHGDPTLAETHEDFQAAWEALYP